MCLSVLDPGFQTSVQDLGRRGYERFGVPAAGAMDRFALMAANRLAGNPLEAAGLEAAGQGPTLRAEADCVVAAGGPGFWLEVDGVRLPGWMSALARRGVVVRLGGGGAWGYLAVSGGIDTPPLMGSRATWLRGGVGGLAGRALQKGDVLPVGRLQTEIPLQLLAGRSLPAQHRPPYSPNPRVEVILGPQLSYFDQAGVEIFLNSEYALSLQSDRMGLRLSGPGVAWRAGAGELLSEGMPLGAVQIPPDGQPIVLMADRQTTGGYPKIGVVSSADLPLLAQCEPGSSRMRFSAVSVTAAQMRWRGLVRGIIEGVED